MNEKEIIIHDLNSCDLSDRNGTYGGMAGLKEGIVYNGENWLIKYPKNTKGMKVQDISYSTSPLSEFIGSHIYSILGYDVHETILGERNNKIVVGCKDFCGENSELREIRTLKNIYNERLEEILNMELDETSSNHLVDLKELLIHFNNNPVLSKINGLKERFWECAIIDGLIKNNDRNNGNWGLLFENKEYKLAPIFDNGASFSNKVSDEQIKNMLVDKNKLINNALNSITAYSIDGKRLNMKKMLELDIPELKDAILKVTPIVKSKLSDIREMIEQIPAEYKELPICSFDRKTFYIEGFEIRFNQLLFPAYNKIMEKIKQ